MKTFWKICGWGALVIVLLFALILGVVSPIAKYVVNNHGEDIVGRELHADQSQFCREQVLLAYFGEKNAVPCGHCDVCRELERIILQPM